MKNVRIPLHAALIASLALASAAFATNAAAAGSKPHAAAKAEPTKPVGEVVEYAALESRVGQTLAIETTFKTTRTGKLIKYTQPTLTLQMGTDANPMELTVPKETIKSIMVLTPAAAEPAKDTGTSGAKKN
jgi:hypothetical protein